MSTWSKVVWVSNVSHPIQYVFLMQKNCTLSPEYHGKYSWQKFYKKKEKKKNWVGWYLDLSEWRITSFFLQNLHNNNFKVTKNRQIIMSSSYAYYSQAYHVHFDDVVVFVVVTDFYYIYICFQYAKILGSSFWKTKFEFLNDIFCE